MKLFFRLINFILVISFLGCATTYNPATDRKEFIWISTEQEEALGQDVHQQILKQYRLSRDQRKVNRLKRIGQDLTQVAERQDYQYHFYLIEKEDINAFTTPGGSIYMFSGLMDKLETDDEIAAVLAHEIGHCTAKHTVKKFQRALGYNLIASIALSQIGNQDTQSIAALGAGVAINIASAPYSKRAEFEADRLAIRYMKRAGYDLNGIIKTFSVLKNESTGVQPPAFLSSHPHIDERIKAVEAEIQQYQL